MNNIVIFKLALYLKSEFQISSIVVFEKGVRSLSGKVIQ